MPAITKPLAGRGDTASALRSELGQYIRELRTKRGMTQNDLAKQVGMNFYTGISAIEVGRSAVPPERYLDFARALGVNPKTFMKRVLQMTNPWAHALLFAENPEGVVEALNERIDTRLS